MSEHMFVTCTVCGAKWDLDYEPNACTCEGGDLEASIETQIIEMIEMDE